MALRKYTLVGEGQAKVGYKFVYRGVAEACRSCKRRKFCVEPLDLGRIYVVKNVLFKRFSCDLHGPGARLVEVEESVYEANLETHAAVLDALITFQPVECDLPCPHRERCYPIGLIRGDRCLVVEVGLSPHCPRGRKLSFVRLRRKPGGG